MRPMTKRQLEIVKMITETHTKGCRSITLDEIMKGLNNKGFHPTRNSMIVCMKMLCKRLNEDGIKVKPKKGTGRSIKQEYYW